MGQQLVYQNIGGGVNHAVPGKPVNVSVPWKNTLGVPLYIKSVQMFMGVGGLGTICDFLSYIVQESTGYVLIFNGWDHYAAADSAQANNPMVTFEPNYFLLPENDSLLLCSTANMFMPFGPDYTTQTSGWFWWTALP